MKEKLPSGTHQHFILLTCSGEEPNSLLEYIHFCFVSAVRLLDNLKFLCVHANSQIPTRARRDATG